MDIEGAVATSDSDQLSVEQLTIEPPRTGEVLVRNVATGVCHTDISVLEKHHRMQFPSVLGHEGAGIVEAVGNEVTSVSEGDHVILTYDYDDSCPNCKRGDVAYCDRFFAYNFSGHRPEDGSTPLSRDDEPIGGRFFGQSSFATHSIATERNIVPVADDLPLEILGPLGCGVQTGAGGVINVLDPVPGSSLVVFGAGAVGLSSIMAGSIIGCTEIIAVDLERSRLTKARELGATHTIDANQNEVQEAIRGHLDGGADYAIETTAVPSVLRSAVEVLRPKGTCCVIGAPPGGTEVSLDVNKLLLGRTVRGTIEGDTLPQLFIPTLIELYRQGRFPFDELITFFNFEEVQEAIEAAKSGEAIKPVIRIESP